MNKAKLFILGVAVAVVVTGLSSYLPSRVSTKDQVVLGHRIAPNGVEILVVATK